MADQIQQESGDPTSEDFSDNIPTGKRAIGLLHTVEGTSAGSSVLKTADLGRMNLDIFAKQRINAPLGFFNAYGREHEGTLEKTNPTAGPTRITSFIPLYYAEEPNGIPVQTVKDLVYSVEHSQGDYSNKLDTSVDATATLRVLYSSKVQFNYVPEIERSTLQFNGAGTETLDLNESDVVHLYVREKESNANSDIIDRIDVTKDGERVTARGVDADAVKDASVITANVETPQSQWAHLSLMEGSAQAGGYQNSQVDVEVTTNAGGTVQIVSFRRVPRNQA